MTKIIQFKQEPEYCECEVCELVSEHIDEIADSESYEELFAQLREFAAKAQHIGFMEHLELEIESKMKLYNQLTSPCADCDCEDDCELED